MIKLYAVYDEPFWLVDGLTGQAASDEGPVKVTFDKYPPAEPLVRVVRGSTEANYGRVRGPPVVGGASALCCRWACFVRYFGPKAANPVEYIERDWMAKEFSRGCHGAHFTPGVWGDSGRR